MFIDLQGFAIFLNEKIRQSCEAMIFLAEHFFLSLISNENKSNPFFKLI